MNGYDFRLQPLLKIKTMEEEQLQKRLADCRRRFQERNQAMHRLEENKVRHLQELEEDMANSRIDLENTRWTHRYLEGLGEEIARLAQQIQQLERELERRRGELLDKSKEKKSLEKLKEKEQEAFKKEMLKKEQKEIDELAQTRFLHFGNFRAAGGR